MSTFAIPNEKNGSEKQKTGAIAQLVEQRTENPCVPGSIPGGTTKNLSRSNSIEVFSFCGHYNGTTFNEALFPVICYDDLIDKLNLASVAWLGLRRFVRIS